MKKQILIIALTAITVGLMLIGSAITAAAQSEFTVPLSEPGKKGKLKAQIQFGSITVKGTPRKDVLVRYSSAEEDDDNEEVKNGLRRIGGGGIDLEVTETSNVVKVSSNSHNRKINLEIEVPASFDMQVSTHNDGDLLITNIQGALELTNHNGDITALNISGSVVATSFNGELKITFDKVSDETPMSYTTYNGDIDVTFPAALKATLKMKTEQGDIYSGFDVAFKSSGPVQKSDTKGGVYKINVDEWKRGDINGGGPEITIKNYNGDIYVRKK